MDKEDINLDDITRILFGEAPYIFLLEVLLRTLIIYLVFVVIIRFMGKRMAGQLTITELAVMLTLGAIVAPAMQAPEIGILLGIFVLVCVYVFQRGLTLLNFKNQKIEVLTQGMAVPLVQDGVLNFKEMRLSRITQQQVYTKLRGSGIFNLGEVERMYFEACGEFSIFRSAEPRPGLPLFPPGEAGLAREIGMVEENIMVCKNCGTMKGEIHDNECPVCGNQEWVNAVNKNG